jgi:hypothetical protein
MTFAVPRSLVLAACLAVSSGGASAATLGFDFVQNGFLGSGQITGAFSGVDLDGDGVLNSEEGEITSFALSFSGAEFIPAFTLALSDLTRLIYGIGNATLGGDPANDQEGILAIGSFTYAAGPGPVDFCLDNAVCGLIFAEDAPITSTGAITVSEAVAPSPVPLPAPALLLVGGLAAMGALRMSTTLTRRTARSVTA